MSKYNINENIIFTVSKGRFVAWNLQTGHQYDFFDRRFLDRFYELTTSRLLPYHPAAEDDTLTEAGFLETSVNSSQPDGYTQKICWVQGKCEIGPRALGNRSIFAAPFLKTTTTKLNQIKNREHYRPIAPICLEEDAALHFEECTSSKFMLTFYTVTDPRLKAITHVDGTARVQTITYRDSPATYELLKNFKEATDVGVLCNTSLNFSGSGFINNRTDLERFCIKHNIMTFVINDTMYIKPGDR